MRPVSTSRGASVVAALVVLLLAVGGVWWAVRGQPDDRPAPAPAPSTSSSGGSGPLPTWTIGQARAALAHRGATVVVLGDSTGDSVPFPEWVQVWGKSAGLRIATWDRRGQQGYRPARGPVRLWNGSMSGSRADYPLLHWDAMWPAQAPDLVLLSYGHNYTAQERPEEDLDALHHRIARAAPNAPLVVVLQQPQRGDANRAVRERVSRWAQAHGLPRIDVAAAFHASGHSEASLLVDDLHPSRLGSQIWADAVDRALGAPQAGSASRKRRDARTT